MPLNYTGIPQLITDAAYWAAHDPSALDATERAHLLALLTRARQEWDTIARVLTTIREHCEGEDGTMKPFQHSDWLWWYEEFALPEPPTEEIAS